MHSSFLFSHCTELLFTDSPKSSTMSPQSTLVTFCIWSQASDRPRKWFFTFEDNWRHLRSWHCGSGRLAVGVGQWVNETSQVQWALRSSQSLRKVMRSLWNLLMWAFMITQGREPFFSMIQPLPSVVTCLWDEAPGKSTPAFCSCPYRWAPASL